MGLQVMGEKDAQQLSGAGALLAARAAGGEVPDEKGHDRDDRGNADAELEEEVARPHDVERNIGRHPELVEVVDVQDGVGHPVDEDAVQGLVHEDGKDVVEHGRPEDRGRPDADGAEDVADIAALLATALLAAALLASAQSCTPIPRRS